MSDNTDDLEASLEIEEIDRRSQPASARNRIRPKPEERPISLQEAILLSMGIDPAMIGQHSREVRTVFVDGEQIWPAVAPESQPVHGTTPPPMPEIPIDKYDRTYSTRHRDDQKWIAKVTEGMRKDLKDLYGRHVSWVHRELGDRYNALDTKQRSTQGDLWKTQAELKRALETIGRQTIELEELKKGKQ